MQRSVAYPNLELLLLLCTSSIVIGDFNCYENGFEVIGNKPIYNTEILEDEDGVVIDWIKIVDPPEAVICIKTFTIFYGLNWKYQSPRCIATSADEVFPFPCTGFRNETLTPSTNSSHTNPIYLDDICKEYHRDLHLDITPIGPGDGDGDDDNEKGRDIKETRVRITNETARIFVQLEERNLPPCPTYEEHEVPRPKTYHWASFFVALLACTGVLIMVFILSRHYQVQKKKLDDHAWRGWKLVEPVEDAEEDAKESCSIADEVQEAQITTDISDNDEHVNLDIDEYEQQRNRDKESFKNDINLVKVKETDEISRKSIRNHSQDRK